MPTPDPIAAHKNARPVRTAPGTSDGIDDAGPSPRPALPERGAHRWTELRRWRIEIILSVLLSVAVFGATVWLERAITDEQARLQRELTDEQARLSNLQFVRTGLPRVWLTPDM